MSLDKQTNGSNSICFTDIGLKLAVVVVKTHPKHKLDFNRWLALERDQKG